MLKIKWLYSELPTSLSQLASRMKENQYSEERKKGFILATATSSKLVGKYIEKTVKVTIVEDPFGVTSEVENVEYYVCQFNWILDSNYMYISNPPRTLRKFTNILHELTGIGLVLSEIDQDPIVWLENIERDADSFSILQVSAFGIRTSPSSTAKIIVTGSSEVRETFSELVNSKRYVIDCVRFEASFGELVVKGELTKNGVCRIKALNTKFFLSILRESIDLQKDKN